MLTLLRYLWSHNLLLWKWRDDDNETKWEVLRKKITERRGKSWGIYRHFYVTMACVTANLLVLHKMNPVAHSCRLHGLPTILWFSPIQSDVVRLFTGMNHGERPSKSLVCVIQTVHSLSEKTSPDLSLTTSLGSCMIQTVNIRSWCTVRIAIPNVVTFRTQLLLCTSQLRFPTST